MNARSAGFFTLACLVSSGIRASDPAASTEWRFGADGAPGVVERCLLPDGTALAETLPGGPFAAIVVRPDGKMNEETPVRAKADPAFPGGSSWTFPFGTVRRTVERFDGYPSFKITNRLEAVRAVRLARLTDTLVFLPRDPEFAWSQNLKWTPDDVLPHWTFKFPALMVQKGTCFLGLFMKIDAIRKETLDQAPLAFDFRADAEGRFHLSTGFIAHRRGDRHVNYVAAPEVSFALREGDLLEWSYFLAVDDRAPEREGFRRLLHWSWETFGRPRLLSGAACQQGTDEKKGLALFDDWRQEAWKGFGPQVWHEAKVGEERRGGYSTFWIKEPNAWFDAWFNSVRTAYGEFLYGRRHGDADAMSRARAVVNLILSAPRKEGAFPSICINRKGEDAWVFENERGRPALPGDPSGHPDCYHPFDMTWTGYWLVRFARDLAPEDARILPFCEGLGGFLLARQLPSGCVPAWIDAKTLVPDPDMRDVNAETSGTAHFLAELHRSTGRKEYLDGAVHAADYLWREIVPTRRWFDFEAFVSCSKKRFDFRDPVTRQFPANTLSMIRAGQAFVSLFAATGERVHLERALSVTDFLLLHQQPWSHPLMRENLFGGFAVQNGDLEWSDTRAPYAAELLFSLYEHTGTPEYLERAVAALRANFKVSPRENWGHGGDEKGPTGRPKFHWGTGSGAATVEMVAGAYGEAYIHAGRRHGVGIDGCTLRQLAVEPGRIDLEIDSPFMWKRRARLVVAGLPPGKTCEVSVNGEAFVVAADDAGRAEILFTVRPERR